MGSPIDINVPKGKGEYYESMIHKVITTSLKTEESQLSLLSLISEIPQEDMKPLDKLILIDYLMNLISLPSQSDQ